jgi:hypothetical protein
MWLWIKIIQRVQYHQELKLVCTVILNPRVEKKKKTKTFLKNAHKYIGKQFLI